MTNQEKRDFCTKAFMSWFFREKDDKVDMTKHQEDIANIFTSQVLLKKFEVFDINIIIPDDLLLILAICTDQNPGMVQIILKDLLNSIYDKKGPIPEGYIITTEDFTQCFMSAFPIASEPEIYDKYEKLWDGQKYQAKDQRLNLCDTIGFWSEVMK